jgi:hypothetical protein
MAARASAAGQEGGLVRNRRAARAGAAAAASWASCGYGGGEDERGGVVTGETWGMLLVRAVLYVGEMSHTELRVSRTAASVRQYSIAMQGPTGS